MITKRNDIFHFPNVIRNPSGFYQRSLCIVQLIHNIIQLDRSSGNEKALSARECCTGMIHKASREKL
jgi:hypothetical protein